MTFRFNPITASLDMVQVLDESIAHSSLSDMPDITGVNTDHDSRYFTETETTNLLANKLTSTDLFPSSDTRYEQLPEFPETPIKPYFYLLGKQLWYYDTGTSSWSKYGTITDNELIMGVLTSGVPDFLEPTTYPANTVWFNSEGIPLMMWRWAKCKRPIDHRKRIKAKITSTQTTFTGQANDWIDLQVDNQDGLGVQTFAINLATATQLFSPPYDNTVVEYLIYSGTGGGGGGAISSANDGSGHLVIKNGLRNDGHGARGKDCYIKINKYGYSNPTVLTRLGFTANQNDTVPDDGTQYTPRKGSGWHRVGPVSLSAVTANQYSLPEYKWFNGKLYTWSFRARDMVTGKDVTFGRNARGIKCVQWGVGGTKAIISGGLR